MKRIFISLFFILVFLRHKERIQILYYSDVFLYDILYCYYTSYESWHESHTATRSTKHNVGIQYGAWNIFRIHMEREFVRIKSDFIFCRYAVIYYD